MQLYYALLVKTNWDRQYGGVPREKRVNQAGKDKNKKKDVAFKRLVLVSNEKFYFQSCQVIK